VALLKWCRSGASGEWVFSSIRLAHAVGGNLREMEGRYTVAIMPTGAVRLSYSGRLVPDFAVPPVIGKMVVRNVLAEQFRAMVEEIVRRDAEKAQ